MADRYYLGRFRSCSGRGASGPSTVRRGHRTCYASTGRVSNGDDLLGLNGNVHHRCCCHA